MDSVTDSAEAQVDTQPVPAEGLVAVLTDAYELARDAVVDIAGDSVGEYLGVTFEDTTAATHRFLAELPGYRGWQWAVVVAAYPGASHATISELVLVPGPTALLAPSWVPWEERVKPGDLGPGDLLAPPAEDPRLVPGYSLSGDPAIDDIATDFGFGRRQVLSVWGRLDAAERWHESDYGPDSAMARSTKKMCRDCGFYLPLAGSLGTMFGVCANALSADGHVVEQTYGCGAHSDTPAPAGAGSPLYEPFDDGVLDVTENPQPAAGAEMTEPTPVVEADTVIEPEPAEAAVAALTDTSGTADATGTEPEQSDDVAEDAPSARAETPDTVSESTAPDPESTSEAAAQQPISEPGTDSE